MQGSECEALGVYQCVSSPWAGPRGPGISCMLVVIPTSCQTLTGPSPSPVSTLTGHPVTIPRQLQGCPGGSVKRRVSARSEGLTGLGITGRGSLKVSGHRQPGDSWSWVLGAEWRARATTVVL